MPSHSRIGARRGHVVTVDLAQWPDVDHDALPDQRRAQYLTRRTAVTMYLAGASGSCPSAWCKSTARTELRCAVLSEPQRTAEWEQHR